MLGVAKAYDLDVGIIVAVNLVYQLESIGINCSNWNNTGPTTKDDPGCVDTDPSQKWCYCRDPKLKKFINPDTGILPPPKYVSPTPTHSLSLSLSLSVCVLSLSAFFLKRFVLPGGLLLKTDINSFRARLRKLPA